MPRTPTGGGSKPRKLKRKPAPPPRKLVQRGHGSESGRVVRGQPQRGHAAEGPKVLRRATQRPLPKARREQLRKAQKVVSDTRKQRYLKEGMKRAEVEVAANPAPVLKALEQTTRPLHGIAAGTRAAIHGRNVPKAVGRGLANKDKSTFSDVLKDLGAPKVVRNVGGFALDVAADPTTYVTFGVGSVARKVALDAGKAAERKALRKGLSKPQAAKFRARAEKQALRRHPDSTGATVKVGGREVPKVRKATARAAVPVRKTLRRATPDRARSGARRIAAEVRPTIRADTAVPKAEYREIRRAARTTRYSTSREIEKTRLKARAMQKQLKGRDQEVLDAIEAGRLRDLPDELRPLAKRLQDQLKYARRLERRAGVNVAERKGYVPHALADKLERGEGIVATGVRNPGGSFQKARTEKRTLKEIRQTDPGKYSENAPLLYANRMAEGVKATKRGELNRRLMDMGRTLKKGSTDILKDGEAVYHVKGARIREPDKIEINRVLRTGDGGRGGRYVILNKNTVDEALRASRVPERTAIGAAFDYTQGKWKFLATQPNIGFHVRNLVGDTQNAYLAEPTHKLARNIRQSRRALKRLNRGERSLLLGKALDSDGKGLRIGDKRMSYDSLIAEAEKVGAIRAGFAGRELRDLATTGEGIGQSRLKVLRKAKAAGKGTARLRASQFLKNREDVIRLATYIGGRKRGLSPELAAERAAKYHFDYADLTDFERRIARRVMPFYTFSSRNIPLQFKALVSQPGKYAQYQKVREEVAKAFGVDLDKTEGDLAPQEKRSAPVVVRWKGKQFTLSFGPSGLPLTDLNEFPVGANPVRQADEWMERAMSLVTPAAKTPVELWANVSFFFRDQIERESGPLVPAPSAVALLPQKIRDDLGVVSDYVDKRTGKKMWGWPAKIDYVAHVLPGPFNYLNRVLTPSERKNQGFAGKTLAYAGLRSVPVDAKSRRIQEAYEKRAHLGKQLASLRQRKNPSNDQPIRADNPTPEYTKLLRQYSELDKRLGAMRVARGDRVVPRRGRPKTPRLRRSTGSSSGSGFDLSGLDGGSSGGSSRSRDSSGFDLSGLD